MLHFHFITLFPETIRVWLTTSILGRAHRVGLFTFDLLQLRDFSTDKHRTVDDSAYGGGGGMVLKIEPLVAAVESIFAKVPRENALVLCLSPAGRPLNQNLIESLSRRTEPRHFVFICGHYEGIDQRFVDHWVDLEISLGDFVLTGGELPALAVADALIRQLEGALGHEEAAVKESFVLRNSDGKALLEYPHYTRPADFRGLSVPPVLLSGDHEKVAQWRLKAAIDRTLAVRPDLLANFDKAGPSPDNRVS
jgi:tRNA (guanine37-N1)-methyltransferase